MKSAASFIVFSAIFFACSRSAEVANTTPDPEPFLQSTPDNVKPEIPIHIAEFTSSELCDRLISIDTLPTHDPSITDPIYESLIAKGDEAIPCLVEKITDTRSVPDPRYSVPHWQHYVVGDTAVFIILRILSHDNPEKWEHLMLEMLPPKYKTEWESNGIYAYFNYVSETKNRRELQRWWKNLMAKNMN